MLEADHPELLTIAIFIQHDLEDPDDIAILKQVELLSVNNAGNIVYEVVGHKEAKNAYYARYRVQKLYSGQDYQLQIDSHMRLIKGWDTKLKSYLADCPERSILTVYPRPFKVLGETAINQQGPPVAMCFHEFSQVDGLPRFKSRSVKKPLSKPFNCLFWAAGFSFSRGSLLVDCPYTDEIDNVFFGEELFQMMKFFKKGY